MTMLWPFILLSIVIGIESLSLGKGNSIIDVTIDCGVNQAANNPVLSILTDVDISAVAKCKNGEKSFTTTDSVHYTLPATLTTRDSLCELNEKDGSDNFDIEVEVHYGELDNLILTRTKIVTVVCTYGGYGKDNSSQHSIRDGPQAYIEEQTIVGGSVPASDLTLSIQTVYDEDAVGSIAFDRRYSLYGSYTGSVQNVGLKPVSCDAISDDGERYAVLVAGCGDGLIFDRTEGFITTGTTFRSPYFFGFHLAHSENLAFDCNVTLCSPSCEGTSCETVCGTVTAFSISNGHWESCQGDDKFEDTCTFICDIGHDQSGDGVSTCGADGIWTTPTITCTPKDCSTPPPGTFSTGSASSGTTYTKTADYSCNEGYQVLSGDVTISCLATGSWDMANALVCEPKDCGNPPSVVYTTVTTPTGTTYLNEAVYTCKTGTKPVSGDTNIGCLSSGSWNVTNTLNCQCFLAQDVVFVLDGSGSVEAQNFRSMVTTLANAIPRFDLGPTSIHAGAVVFDTAVRAVIPLSYNGTALQSLIASVPYPDGGTAAGVGIARAQQMLIQSSRTGVPKIMVVLADGESSPDPQPAATQAKNAGTIIHTIGVTSGADMGELTLMASDPNKANYAATWGDMDDILSDVFEDLC